jgi:tRNA(Ile)-lysidine synthetase-like protein
MRYIVAVSGGVDSVVLLDMLVRIGGHELIVAHFDHGIRKESAADARFVEALAKMHGLVYISAREELGERASEEMARERRYAFLRNAANTYEAQIVTAHHGDDLVETIAINLTRGTGWRGAAVLDAPDVLRPLLHRTKYEILNYALHYRLEWVEDITNRDPRYLRNRLRLHVGEKLSDENKREIVKVWENQLALKEQIEAELQQFLAKDNGYSRYFFTCIEPVVACEILRAVIVGLVGVSPTRPQVERALLAIKTARAHTRFELGGRVKLRFSATTFIVETP